MITYCSKCGINWANLWTDDSEDAVEVCPICKTDMHLQDATDFVSYIKCPFTGGVINTTTGTLIQDTTPYKKPVYRIKVGKPVRETDEEKEAREDAALIAYMNSGDRSQYFKTIKKSI